MVVARVLSGCISTEGRCGVDKGGGGSGVTLLLMADLNINIR